VSLRKDAAARADLDEVGAVLDHLADLRPRFPGAVGDTALTKMKLGREEVVVAVAARDAQRGSGNEEPRTRHLAGIDRVAQRDVGKLGGGDVAHGGKSSPQRSVRVGSAVESLARSGNTEPLVAQVLRNEGEMVVNVDQPGKEGRAAQIEDSRVGRKSHVRA